MARSGNVRRENTNSDCGLQLMRFRSSVQGLTNLEVTSARYISSFARGASQFLNTCEKLENSCGAASEDSPRREPWGTCWGISKPRQGRKKNGGSRVSFAAPRLLPV